MRSRPSEAVKDRVGNLELLLHSCVTDQPSKMNVWRVSSFTFNVHLNAQQVTSITKELCRSCKNTVTTGLIELQS